MPPRFSIVVPCHRLALHRELVEHCVASVALQDFADYELLLVDDGSPDDTAQILAQTLAAHDPLRHRARILALPENGGVCAARNAGIDAARGDYVAFLDFDDLWQPAYLARMHEAASRHPNTPVFLARTDFMRTMGKEIRVRSTGPIGHLNALDDASFNAWHLQHNFPVGMGSAVVVARRLYEEQPDLKFDLALTRTTAEDVLFGFQLLARGIRPWYVDEPLCIHRSISHRISRGSAAFLRCDEGQVNEYIAQRATNALVRRVIEARPEFKVPITAQLERIRLEFDLKREYLEMRHWFGLRKCLRQPRGFKSLLRLFATRLALDSPLEVLLQRYLFSQGGNDPLARARVVTLVNAICLASTKPLGTVRLHGSATYAS